MVKEVDSHDKFTRSNAIDACVAIYKTIGENFWKMAGKNVNQKVKDLIQSKISAIPKDQIKPKTGLKKATKLGGSQKAPKKSLRPPSKQKAKDSKLQGPSKISGLNKTSVPKPKESRLKSPSGLPPQEPVKKSFKKFIPKTSDRKSFSKPTSIPSTSIPSKEEGKRAPVQLKEELCTARPVQELVDFDHFDHIGKIIHKVLFGVIEDKFDALVLFNETLTTKLDMMKESLAKNALFISRTFSDVMDGVLDPRREDVPAKFVKYFIQVFKK